MYGIKEVRKELLANLQPLEEAALNKEAECGRWTIAQVTEHLILMEQKITSIIKKELADENSMPSDGKKPIEKALDRSHKFDAPEYLEPAAQFYAKEDLENRLDESRKALQHVISQLNDIGVLAEKSAKHRVFGRMDLAQWIEFIGIHEQRHVDQIKELKTKL